MSSILDHAVVAAALLLSVAYALLSLGPRDWRRRAFSFMAQRLARAPAAAGLGRLARLLEAAAGRSGACGGCDSCASGTSKQAMDGNGSAQAPDRTQAAPGAAEIKIPLHHIGRRR